MSHDQQIAADDWTDTDLLTKQEAAERLDDEIVLATSELAKLNTVGGDAAAAVELLTRRLAAMQDARDALSR
ncbi:hypothetical protein [Nocardia miyunensis]|uniref:hypothetical protein n=1 Tax=Nocardia miyunensis TaxID=282684 RepID=UPI000833A48C|nr:hypothetical protein [Nocardia miyunensis]